MLFVCDAKDAQFLQSRDGNKIYHDTWLRSVRRIDIDYEDADIAEITESEYEDLLALLEDQSQIPVEDDETTEEQNENNATEENINEEKPMSISEMRDRIKELTDLVDKLTSTIAIMNSNVD
jgi:hypothetical protein